MSTDIAIRTTVSLPNAGGLSKKPPYLIELSESKKKPYFLSLDRPEFQGNFVQVKGVYIDSSKLEELERDAITFASQIAKENICDMIFPIHRILSIKNVAYKAAKNK